jgi:hypothetical protein
VEDTDKVAARLARMQKRAGYAEREQRHFEQWEKQFAPRYKPTWNAHQADVRHERRMSQAIGAA